MKLQQIFQFRAFTKLSIEVLWDGLSLVLALILAYLFRIGLDSVSFGRLEWLVLVLNVLFTQSMLTFLGHYRQVIRYINLQAIYIIFLACLTSTIYLFAAKYSLNIYMPTTVPLIYFLLSALFLAAPRLLIQATSQLYSYRMREKCIIFGASQSGRALASTLRAGHELLPVAFIDDKRKYQGKQVLGLTVAGRQEIPAIVAKHGVKKMLLAVNNTSAIRRKELITELEPFAIELLSIPNIQDIISGKRRIDELREIQIDELLGREPVPPVTELLDVNITGKAVMVTGAGGSIGSELCRQLIKSKPTKLVLFELAEFNLYQIENELSRAFADIELVTVLASVQDNDVLRNTVERHGIQTIYHAAAYKHVPMVEHNITAGIRNNVFGTSNVALIAAEYGVEKFVLVSTDKAVRPTNIMGASKRLAELYIQGIAELHSETEFAIVRFGNVLGSSGSVVPLFSEQIRAGGPITVTHPDIIRYFMTIPEAAQLVIQAGAMGKRGEVFVLDMGEPVKIVDLASKMAHLLGYKLSAGESGEGVIKLKYTGLRAGEKLYEELLIDDGETQTQHPRIMGANEKRIEFAEVVMLLDQINYALLRRDEGRVKQLLIDAPLAYTPASHSMPSKKRATVNA